jgi:DNA-binding MarR family transcriptional regulator
MLTGMKRPKTVEPDDLDLGSLALFLGYAAANEVQHALVNAGFSDVRFSHGFVFQHLIDGDKTVGELADRMQVTQQAASKVVAELESRGLVRRAADASDARLRRVTLARRGLEAVHAARSARSAMERRFEAKLGAARLASARRVLADAIDVLGGREAIRRRRIIAPS